MLGTSDSGTFVLLLIYLIVPLIVPLCESDFHLLFLSVVFDFTAHYGVWDHVMQISQSNVSWSHLIAALTLLF